MKYFIFVFILVISAQLNAQTSKLLTIGSSYTFEIKDGSNRSGRLDSTTTFYYFINNPAIGVDRISKSSVSKIKEIKLNIQGFFANPHYSRYFFGPSAIAQPKGEFYWNNVLLEYNTIQYGVSENLSVGVGGFLFNSLSGNVIMLPNAKYSFKLSEKSHIAIGGLMAIVHVKSSTSLNSAALPFVVYTYGNSEANLSVGAGWAHENEFGWAPKPTGFVAGMKRLSRNWVLQGEAFMFNNSTNNSIYFTTLRYIRPSSSWDFGAMSFNFEDLKISLPVVGYTLKF